MKFKFAFFITFTLFSSMCFSEPASRESIEKMFEVTDVKKMLDSLYAQMDIMLAQMITHYEIPEEKQPVMEKFIEKYTALVRSEMSWEKVKDPIIDAYASVFTEEDIEGIVKFYASPAGKKMITKIPELMQASMQLMQQSLESFIPKLQQLQLELAQDLAEAS